MPHPSSNADLRDHFSADRSENRNVVAGTDEYVALRQRDAIRRMHVSVIISSLTDATAEDLYHAAWVLNHGDLPEEARRAHALASRAAALGLEKARWLAAASFDRACMYDGKLQKYGTQIVPDGIRYRVWDTDPGTTDAERAEFCVPPISDQHSRAEELSRTVPQPPMDEAPTWLKSAIARWSQDDVDNS